MIKFRQKMYIAPLAAGALLSKAGGLAMNGLNMAGQASMIGGVIQGQQQMKQAEQHQQQNARLQKQQMRVEAQKAEAINNLANSSAGQTPAGQAVQQGLFSERKVLKNQKLFARYNVQDVKGFGKDMLGHLKKNKKHITGFLGFGMTMTAGKYLADKLIQQDKSVMTKPEEKTYSINFSNDIGNFKEKMSIKAAVPALVMGSLTPVASYLGDKAQQTAVAEKSKKKKEKEFSISSTVSRAAKKSIIAIKRGAWNRKQNMKVIDKITNGPESKIRDPRTWHWVKKVRHNPVRGLANVYNSMSMMGGETGMKNFQNSLTGKGSSGSRLSKDISDFMSNHGATSMAAIGAIGGSTLVGMSNLADKVSEKGFRLADKNAFKYTDSKEEEMK